MLDPKSGGYRPDRKAVRRKPTVGRLTASGGYAPGAYRPGGNPRPAPRPSPQPRPKPAPQRPINSGPAPYKDESYFNTVASEAARRDNTLNSLTAQESTAKIGYGFDTDIATNPYSRAALLQKNYDTAQKGTMNSMAAGGQLYSGAHSNARGMNRGNYNANYDGLRKSYDAELARIRDSRQNAGEEYDRATIAAGQSAIARASKVPPGPAFSPARRGKKGKK